MNSFLGIITGINEDFIVVDFSFKFNGLFIGMYLYDDCCDVNDKLVFFWIFFVDINSGIYLFYDI